MQREDPTMEKEGIPMGEGESGDGPGKEESGESGDGPAMAHSGHRIACCSCKG